MREIKFRAWDTDPEKEVDSDKNYMFYQKRTYGGGTWLANFETDFDKETGCSYDSDFVFAHSTEFADWDFVEKERKREKRKGQHINHDRYPDRFILMQYTGLKDKNGKEIYEGDVVKTDDQYYPKKIVTYTSDVINEHDGYWDEWYCGFDLIVPEDEYRVLHYQLSDEVEIIGNIYENPELLKGSDLDE